MQQRGDAMREAMEMPGPDEIAALFTGADGSYRFARWGRPIVPIVFGVDAATLTVVKGATEAVVAMAGARMAETDMEIGANLMIFFFRDWQELLEVPNLDQMIDGLQDVVARLDDAGANQYRTFRFDKEGAIRACFCFIRMDAALDEVPADTIALNLAVQMILTWGDKAFAGHAPLAQAQGVAVVRPDVAAVIRAAYDPVMPAVANDASHALRLAARVAAGGAQV